MKYYEIWFYYYGEDNNKTDYENEYTFYIKSENTIKTKEQLIKYLKSEFPILDEYYARMSYIPTEDYEYLSKWFEINGQEFELGCGKKA